MRLIKDEGHGDLSLVEQHDENIPHYAILSHTWGADSEEITFKDLMEGTGKNKAGYIKIEFCRNQAANDGLQFFWVDTCCIDKSSSAELSEAINSMFRWYENADKCYVYLSDVSTSGHATNVLSSPTTWQAAFSKSRWFSRGWTLQELIAPTSVEFFSLEGDRLGSKRSLEQHICKITGIAIEALRKEPLTEFEVEERFSWAKHRETKRQEDKAYSLLGIFNIDMSLRYGEGRAKAIERLRRKIGKSLNCK
jgi:Heterokaryon incompatibility protein (HET)